MKKSFTIISLFTLIIFNVTAQTTPQELMNRVNTQGVRPPQDRYNMYVDKMNKFFAANEWQGDAIVSIKEIIQRPPSDPNDWYYFVSVKTQKCLKPFYISYDIGDSNIGVVFQVETSFLPAEIKAHIDKQVGAVMAQREKEDAEKKRIEQSVDYQRERNYAYEDIYLPMREEIPNILDSILYTQIDTIILPDFPDDIKFLIFDKCNEDGQTIIVTFLMNELNYSEKYSEMYYLVKNEIRLESIFKEMYDKDKNTASEEFIQYWRNDLAQIFSEYFETYFPGSLEIVAKQLQDMPFIKEMQISIYRKNN